MQWKSTAYKNESITHTGAYKMYVQQLAVIELQQ